MSATNRDTRRPDDDYYATPPWVVDRLLEQLPIGPRYPESWIVDPGCGDGAIMERIVQAGVQPGFVIGVENDSARAALARERFPSATVLDEDYLGDEIPGYMERRRNGAIHVIGNPPYSHAMEFIKRSMDIARDGVVCMLLRLAFLETNKRAAFHLDHPARVFVLPRRPSFCHSFKCKGTHEQPHAEIKFSRSTAVTKCDCPTCGRRMSKTMSDATAYGWFVWGDSKPGTWEVL